MAHENLSITELEAKLAELDAKVHEVGAKFNAAQPGEYHFWGDGPEDFQDSKSWYGDQIFGLYAEMGHVLNLIQKKKALIHAH